MCASFISRRKRTFSEAPAADIPRKSAPRGRFSHLISKGVDYLKILVVRPGIAPYEAEINDGGNIYQQMREIVGGTPQLCYPFEEPAALIYNKEWITQNTPFNRAVNSKQGVVFGTFIICGTDGGDLCSLSPEQAAYYKGMYHHAEFFVGTRGRSQIILMTDPVENADRKETI